MKKRPICMVLLILICGMVSADVVWSEGFNSDFSDSYSSSFGYRFGVNAPGIVTDGSVGGTEGDGFSALNANQTSTGGVASIVGGMDIDLGTVADSGVTYSFSGNFGWRYGTAAAASDLAVHYGQTGFIVDGTTHTAGDFSEFNFGTSTAGQSQLANHSFSYTTVSTDIGKNILVRIRLVDKNNVGTLTQLLADDWQVTAIPEPATLGLLSTLGAGIFFIRRRFVI